MVAQAKLQSDYHVIGLIPATDNRPGKNAYLPSDVITTYDGSQVEVINTDAEGRIIMADALTWAKRYDPAVVIDLATLTGSAVIAVGSIGIPMMGTANRVTMDRLMEAGQATYERLVELPLWKEYMDHLKSDVADLKNVGGREAGAITAGKFLEHFAEFPWIHLDIAGPAFLDSSSSYRPKNGTGVGVRLLSEFIRRH
jgi:leucyl aminopeptidase